jgi:hypothetical protein
MRDADRVASERVVQRGHDHRRLKFKEANMCKSKPMCHLEPILRLLNLHVHVQLQRCSRLEHLSKYVGENPSVFKTRWATPGIVTRDRRIGSRA